MQYRSYTKWVFLVAIIVCGASLAIAADEPASETTPETASEPVTETPVEPATIDDAFETLKTYDWGQDVKLLKPIEEAVVAAHDDQAARKALEVRLIGVLSTDVSRDTKDYVCRKLRVIGTAESVPVLAALLVDEDLSHMARYALQCMPSPEAAKALRDALPNVNGEMKMGVIGSIAAKRDAAAIPMLVALLGESDKGIASSAASALGAIGTPEAARALGKVIITAPEGMKDSVADASLICAELLLANGKKVEAMMVYKSLIGEDQPKHVRLAATRGLLDVVGKKD